MTPKAFFRAVRLRVSDSDWLALDLRSVELARRSNIYSLSKDGCVFDANFYISHWAFDLRVTWQDLSGSQISGCLLDDCCLRAAPGMHAVIFLPLRVLGIHSSANLAHYRVTRSDVWSRYCADPWGCVHEHWSDSDGLNIYNRSNLLPVGLGFTSQWGEVPSEKFIYHLIP